ncbi:hypothetical protein MPSEU_000472400 [Mayamaea pseudoterrestris]|nr:hypothetical protein MPSEU_000472400 [Mayamaea pseudoterrestris]
MARTSRNPVASSMDALDNIDLDDMFADEGDALFDGLDIDLGNMDDITGAASVNDDNDLPMTAPLHEQQTPSQDDNTRRRINKRKIKSPSCFDDDEEELNGSIKKKTPKKRQTKAANSSKKGKANGPTAAVQTAVAPPIIIPDPISVKSKKTKSTMSTTLPHPSQRGIVAAAGQFGGRNKRGSYVLPKAAPVTQKMKPIAGPPTLARASSMEGVIKIQPQHPLSRADIMARIYATHPGLQQGNFCGLLPSNTIFYPFMPTLPNEPSLKQRKLFPVIDRIHTSFLASVGSSSVSAVDKTTSPTSSDTHQIHPIVALMQDCYKDEKTPAMGADSIEVNQQSERATVLVAAANETRRTVSLFDKHQLAGDLMAVCSLLKRQHDFLRQNKSNMEQWCKSHFTEEDYACVFLPIKPKIKRKAGDMTGGSVLASFTKNQIKVKIICSNFDKISSGPLYATLRFGVKASDKDVAPPKSKKAKLNPSSVKGGVTARTSFAASIKNISKSLVPYADMKPSHRRKTIVDLINKCARDLEATAGQQMEDQRQIICRQQTELQKVVDDDKVQMIHSTCMWRWLEKSGHFAKMKDADCQWRLEGLAATKLGDIECGHACMQQTTLPFGNRKAGSYIHRLQSLLVVDDDDETSDDESDNHFDDMPCACPAADLSKLTMHERSFLHLRSFDLVQKADHIFAVEDHMTTDISQTVRFDNAQDIADLEPKDEVDGVVNAMICDLLQVDECNSMRAKLLKSVVHSQRVAESDLKAKNAETSVISRYYQLMKKNKQERGRNEGKPRVAKNDEYALPW